LVRLLLNNEHFLRFSSLFRSILWIDCSILRSSISLLWSLLCNSRTGHSCPCCTDACSPCSRCSRLRSSSSRRSCSRFCPSSGCRSRTRFRPSSSCCCRRARPGPCCSSRLRSPSRRSCTPHPPCLRSSRSRSSARFRPCSHPCRSRPGRLRSCLRSFRLSRLFHWIKQGKESRVKEEMEDCRLSIDCLYKFGDFHLRRKSKLF
ncbi:hypothetical protein PRIPAC_93241, partial [Pristionchus pacificus]